MALINCPECNNHISDQAKKCPVCGFPIKKKNTKAWIGVLLSVILTVGVSGIFLFTASFAAVSLSMVLGVILNLILRNKK